MSNDARAIAEVAAVSNISEPHTMLHYLYAPSSDAANMIAEELKQRGFRTEERLGGDGAKLACTSTPRGCSQVAHYGGECDGWEADVRHQDGSSPRPR